MTHKFISRGCLTICWFAALGSFASVIAQTCELTLYIDAENTKGPLMQPTTVAVNKATSCTFRPILVNNNVVFNTLAEGTYEITIKKPGFVTLTGTVEIKCGTGLDRQVHALFTMCSGSASETYVEGRQRSIDRNTATIGGSPSYLCRQRRLEPLADQQEELNQFANWAEIVRDTEGIPYFIDTETIRRSGDSVSFRFKTERSRTNTVLFYTAMGVCGDNQMRLTNGFLYLNGAPSLSVLQIDRSSFEAKSGSVLFAVLSYACENAKVVRNEIETALPAPQRPKPTKTISGGVLNGNATYLPKPAYPPAARAVRAGGAVNVQVLIDESGNVVSAKAVGGSYIDITTIERKNGAHPLLISASESAALQAKFSPTLLDGKPVKVSGIITYNFVP